MYTRAVLKVKLKDVLDAQGVSTYRLARHLTCTKQSNLYAIVSGRAPSLEALNDILNALQAVTGKVFTVSDVLEFVPD